MISHYTNFLLLISNTSEVGKNGFQLEEQRLLRSCCAETPVPGQDDDRFAYFPAERITRHIDDLGRVTAYHWDVRFNIVAAALVEAGGR